MFKSLVFALLQSLFFLCILPAKPLSNIAKKTMS